jgi:putative PEP-CTERM system TPR-repeat lipoprotein
MALAGCGKETPEALIDSAKALSAKGDYKAAAIQLRNVLQRQPDNGQARFLLGQALNEQVDYVTAEKELRKALEYSYTADSVYPALARAMLGQGKGKEVVAEFNATTLSDPDAEATLRTDIGLAHLGSGARDEARKAFDAALKAKPGYARARVGQAMLVASDHDVAGAMKIVDEILAAAPALPEALELKADLLLAQNDAQGAVEVLDQVAKVQPNNFRARYALAGLHIRQREFDAAAADIAALRKAQPTDPRVAYLDALLAFRQGDAVKTRDAVQQVLKTAPDHAPSLYLAGAADYQLRSYDSAAEYLRRVLSHYPQSGEAQVLLVSIYLQTGRPDKAQELLDPLLRRAPNDAKVLTLAGTAALANNDLANASRYFERAAVIDKDSAPTRARLGQVRLAMGDTDRAMKDLTSASELDAAGYQADLALIAAHLRRKEFTEALGAAVTLEKKQPDNPLTHNVKGVIYGAKGDYTNARASFAKALELRFDYVPAARNLASLDIMEKNPEAARGRFETIIAKQPKNDEAIIGLAVVQAATGVPAKEVEATFERAVATNPASLPAKLALADYQLRMGDAKSALAVLQGAAAANPSDARVLDLLGLAQQRAGESNQAIETYKKLVALQPKAPGPLTRLGALQFAAKDYEAAIQTLQKALVLNPGSLELRIEIANVQAAAGKSNEALAAARAIQKESPKSAAGFAVEGNVYLEQKNWDRAAGAYREAMKRQPSAALAIRLHSLLENQGKPAEALALATNWLRDNPKDAIVRSYLAERALKDKNFKEAAKLYKEILPLQPNNQVVLNNLAWAAMEAKDPGALGYAEKAYALAPENAAILDTYGWILLQNNEVKRAVEVLTAAVNQAPKNADMRLHLAKAQIAAADKAAARKEIEIFFTLEGSAEQRAEAQELLKGLW